MATRTNTILAAQKRPPQSAGTKSSGERRPTLNIHSSLILELKDKTYRDAYVAAQIQIGLPMQIRALRKSRGLSQPELAKLAKMAQSRISEIETPGERKLNLETLLRLAAAFDVGLQVRFVSFEQLIDDDDRVDLDGFSIQTFDETVKAAETKERKKPSRSFGK